MKNLTPSNKSFAEIIAEALALADPVQDDSDEYLYYSTLKSFNKGYTPLYLGDAILKEFTKEYYEKRKVIYVYFMLNQEVSVVEKTLNELYLLQKNYGTPLPEYQEWTTFFNNLISYKRLSHYVDGKEFLIGKVSKL